jgi:hypothetical protein
VAVGDKPNSEYTVEAMMADLRRISRANGYRTEVRTVVQPDYSPDSDMVLQVGAPSVQVWIMGSQPTEGMVGRLHRTLSVWIVGTIKQSKDVQIALLRLMEDVRSVMMWNPQRNHPDNTGANTWGHHTEEESEGFSYMVDAAEGTQAAGMFLSKWRVTYVFPSPSG